MSIPEVRIIKFIKKNHLLSIAVVNENLPYCFSAFYCYDEPLNRFIFTSSKDTFHYQLMVSNNNIAATVSPQTRVIGQIQGVQICGCVRKPSIEEIPKIKELYLRKYPYALLMDIDLWILEPSFYKFTDNTLGFGKKLKWGLDPNKKNE